MANERMIMKSLKQMLVLCLGLVGTKDINDWENGFLEGLSDTQDTSTLSSKQVDVIERIYKKHFSGLS